MVRMRGKDRVGGAKRVVDALDEDPAHHVHDQDLLAAGLERAPTRAGGARRIVRRPCDALQVRQLRQELLLSEYMVAGGDHVGAGPLDLVDELGGKAKPGCGVLSVDHCQVRRQLALQPRQDRLDRLPPRMSDDVGDEQDPELFRAHRSIVGKNKKGARLPGSLGIVTSRIRRPWSLGPR